MNLLREARVTIEPVTATRARIAREAYRDFGKERYPAKLNFRDYFAYALAKDTGELLLFKGQDSGHTDIVPIWEMNLLYSLVLVKLVTLAPG
jgi:ribonuclease VapC